MPPRDLSDSFVSGQRRESGASALQRALVGESAANLGRLGRGVEAAMERLRDATATEREALEYDCAHALWLFFVQREACGMVRHETVIETYGIPSSVLAKVGAQRPDSSV